MSESIHIDVNGMSIYGHGNEDISGLDLTSLDAASFDSPLKISHSTNIHGGELSIPQGKENSVDLNCVSGANLSGDFGVGQDSKTSEGQIITIKASDHIVISGVIHGSAGRQGAHVQIGQHSDQGYQPTKRVSLNLVHSDPNQNVFVVTGWVLPWTIELKGRCVWLRWESFKLFMYVVGKWIVRTILRIPKGVKGPSWF